MHQKQPPARVTVSVDWAAYARSYMRQILTTRDYHTHFKYILHRNLPLRGTLNSGNDRCRLCGTHRETHAHLMTCIVLRPLWQRLASMVRQLGARVRLNTEFIYLGLQTDGSLPKPGVLALHRLVWKFLFIDLTLILDKQTTFNPSKIMCCAVRRLAVRVRAAHAYHVRITRQITTRGNTPPCHKKVSAGLSPIVIIDEGGNMHWSKRWRRITHKAGLSLNRTESQRTLTV